MYVGGPLSGGGRTTVNSSIHGYSDLYSNVDTLTTLPKDQNVKPPHIESRGCSVFLGMSFAGVRHVNARLSSSEHCNR